MSNSYLTEQGEVVRAALLDSIVEISLRESGSLKALAQITIPGVLEINGIRISDSEHDDLWVQFPSFKTGFKYSNAVYFLDEDLTKEMKQKIKEKYFQIYEGHTAEF